MKVAMHILNGRPKGPLLERCIASAERSGLDFRVIENQGRSVLYGRYAGLDCDGTHVTWVDDDDETLLQKSDLENLEYQHPAVFTNSFIVTRGLNIPEWVKDWNLELEKSRIVRPHPTFILEKDFAQKILIETDDLLRSKGWGENFCDYVFRLLISTTVGWKYVPLVAYKWYIHDNNLHQKDVAGMNKIRAYFLS